MIGAPQARCDSPKDFKAFDKAYKEVIVSCNGCHQAIGYGFIEVTQLKAPVDQGIN